VSGGAAGAARSPALDERDETLDAACRMLLRTGAPVPLTALATELGVGPAAVEAAVAEQERRGRVRRDATGAVVASAGISVVPSDYELRIGDDAASTGWAGWAWCAKTALGVLGAVGIGGLTATRSLASGAEVRARFDGAIPTDPRLAVFWPSDEFRDSCASAAEEYCPSFSLFESVEAGRCWAAAGGVPGEVVPVREATERAVVRWAASLDLGDRGRDIAAAWGRPAAAG
jgi:hypothetical protein